MIHIIGEGLIDQSKAFNDVRDALEFDRDVYLGAMWAKPLGIKLKNVAIYNMETLYDGNPLFNIGYLDTLKENIILDYSRKNIDYLRKVGIDAFYLPYGYHKRLERIKTVKKDIDVLFVGTSRHKRRKDLFERLSKKFNLVVAEGFYGDDLDNLIGRAKVHLNVHHCDNQALEVVRINYLLANRCTVISEHGNDPELDKTYENALMFTEYQDIENNIIYALNNPKDGYSEILKIKQDCANANEWINSK